jgi:hypothetical protein
VRSVEEIGDDLYVVQPQDFTESRNARVAEAKEAGQRELAAQLAALKRPSVGAWLVNLLALRRPRTLARLVELGQSLRAAQGSLTPGGQAAAELRDLSARRRGGIDEAVAEVRELAAEAGVPALSAQQVAEVESTLAAAMADEDSAREVQSGRLVKALSYSGFGLMGGSVAAVKPAGSRPAPAAAAPDDAGPAAEERRAAARERVDRARDTLAAAAGQEDRARAEVDRLAEALAELTGQIEEARQSAKAARQARLTAERDLASMERRLAKLD